MEQPNFFLTSEQEQDSFQPYTLSITVVQAGGQIMSSSKKPMTCYVGIALGSKTVSQTTVQSSRSSSADGEVVWNHSVDVPLLHLRTRLTLSLFDSSKDLLVGQAEIDIASVKLLQDNDGKAADSQKCPASHHLPLSTPVAGVALEGYLLVTVSVEARRDLISFQSKPSVDHSTILDNPTHAAVIDNLFDCYNIPDTVKRQIKSCQLAHDGVLAQQIWTNPPQNSMSKCGLTPQWSYIHDLVTDIKSVFSTDALQTSSSKPFCYSPPTRGTTISMSTSLSSSTPLPIKMDLALIIKMIKTSGTNSCECYTLALDDLVSMYAWAKSIRKAIHFFKLHTDSSNDVKNTVNCHHSINTDINIESFDNNYYGPVAYLKDGKIVPCQGDLDAGRMTLRLSTIDTNVAILTLDLKLMDTLTISRDYEPLTSHILTVNILAVSNLPVPTKKQLVSSYVIVKAKGNESCRTISLVDKNPYWDMDFVIKLDKVQLSNEMYLNNHGFALFLFSGIEGHEEIVGQSFVSYHDLLSRSIDLCTVSDVSDVLYKDLESQDAHVPSDDRIVKAWRQQQFDIDMDVNLCVEVGVRCDKDILLLDTSHCKDGIKRSKIDNIYLQISLVASNTEGLGDKFKIIKSRKMFTDATKSEFCDNFTLQAENGLWCAHYIRIVIKEARCWLTEDGDLGEILIPLDDIGLHCKESPDVYRNFGLHPTDRMKFDKRDVSDVVDWDLGKMSICSKLLVNRKSHTAMTASPKVVLRSNLRAVDPYNTQWACVGVTPRGNIVQANSHNQSNMFSMLASAHCLNILDNGVDEFEKQHLDAISSAHQFQRRYIDSCGQEAIEVRIFEVQRRALLPPHDFNRKNLLYTDPYEFSDDSGSIRAPYSPYDADVPLVTPAEFIWDGDWSVDKNIPGAKEEGWYSGFDITLRKRCWIRKAVHRVKKNETIQLTKNSEIHIFENQRRSHFPPYSFGLGNNFLFERHDFSDETGLLNAPYKVLRDSVPPRGYEWDGEWVIDMDHTVTDIDGWSYGREYIDIMNRYKWKCSSTSPGLLTCCRRRKWNRKLRLTENVNVPPSGQDCPVIMSDSSASKNSNDAVDSSSHRVESLSTELHVASAEETGAALASLNAIMADEIERGGVEVHIFENQRRSAFPPYQYGPGNSLPFERLDFSDESGQVNAPYKCLAHAIPPDGFEWDGEWEIDFTHIETEVDGWSYGIDYTAIMREYVNKTNRFSRILSCCRRRRWKRKVKPISQRKGDNFVAGLSVDLAKQLAIEFSNKVKLDEEHESGSSSKILESCKEKDSLMSPISIPWHQVVAADVVSPSVLAIRVKVHRFFGTNRFSRRVNTNGVCAVDKECIGDINGVFREVEVDFYVLNCPSYLMLSIIRERIYFAELRHQLCKLSVTRMITGDIQYPYNLQAWSLNSENSGQGSTDDEVLFVANDLSLGSEVVQMMDKMQQQLWFESASFSDETGLSLVSKQHVEQLRCRALAYMSAIIEMRVKGPSFKLSSLKAVLELDTSVAERFLAEDVNDKSSVALSANGLTSFFLDVAETRIRDICVCGLGYLISYKEAECDLRGALSLILHHYYANIIALLGKYFDSRDALLSVQGNEQKIDLIMLLFDNNDKLNYIVQSALRVHDFYVTPEPVLSRSLDFNALLCWYQDILTAEITYFLDNAFERNISDNSTSPSLSPWEVISSFSPCRSNLVVDALSTLENYMCTIASKVEKNVRGDSGRDQLLHRIEMAFHHSFLHIVALYEEFLLTRFDWKSLPEQANDLNSHTFESTMIRWLSSIANDAVLLRTEAMPSHISDTKRNRLPRAKLEDKFSCLTVTAVDILSCFIFGRLSYASFKFPMESIHKTWRVEELVENSVSEMGPTLAECAACLHPHCFLELMKLFVMKISVWYLFFLKGLSKSMKNDSLKESDMNQIREDMQIVIEFVREGPVDLSEELKEDMQICEMVRILFSEPVGGAEFGLVVHKLHNSATEAPSLSESVTRFLEIVLKMRQSSKSCGDGLDLIREVLARLRERPVVSDESSVGVDGKKQYLTPLSVVFGCRLSKSKNFLKKFLMSTLQSDVDIIVDSMSTPPSTPSSPSIVPRIQGLNLPKKEAMKIIIDISEFSVTGMCPLKEYPEGKPELRFSFADKIESTKSLNQDNTEREVIVFSIPRSSKKSNLTLTCNLVYKVTKFKKMTIGTVVFPLARYVDGVETSSNTIISAELTPNKVHRMTKVSVMHLSMRVKILSS